MKKISLIAFLSLALIGCDKKQTEELQTNNTTLPETPKGKTLMETKCNLCHNPSADHKNLVAPPMIAVKAMYLKDGASREEFIKNFVDFAKDPSEDKSKMAVALERFNLMPKQSFSEENLTKIAEYIYDYQIEEPSWFKKHWAEKHGTTYNNSGKKLKEVETEKTPTEIGLSYALGTKKVLGKNLMGTIQKKGTLAALSFCNHKAYPLTDSMSTKFNAKIKRVSDKPRNQANQANAEELAIIESYKKMLANKEEIKPITKEHNGGIQFYAPIKTNSMCLQCHGTPEKQIKPAVLNELAKLYPNDKAKGYSENQVRGIWSIYFEKK